MPERHACHPRKRFTSVESATAAATAIYRRDRVEVKPKRCTKCGGYHLN